MQFFPLIFLYLITTKVTTSKRKYKTKAKYYTSHINKTQLNKAILEAKRKFDLFKAGKLAGEIPKFELRALISVILPAFNMEKYIATAIRSIQNQSFKDLEIVVVDDKSTDGTVQVVKEMLGEDKRIRLFENKENRGTLFTRSFGTYAAKGEYVVYLDPDDLFFNRRILEIAYENAREKNVDIVEFMSLKGNQMSLRLFTRDVFSKDKTIFYQPELKYRPYFLNNQIRLNAVELCFKLIKRQTMIKTLDHLKSKGILDSYITVYEDQLVNFYLYHKANSSMILREYGVYYYQRPYSASNSFQDEAAINRTLSSALKVMNFLYEKRDAETEKGVRKFFEYLYFRFVKRFFSHGNKDSKEWRAYVRNVRNCDFCGEKFKKEVLDSFVEKIIEEDL